MSIFKKIFNPKAIATLSTVVRSAATAIPAQPLPTVKAKRQALPSYLKSAKISQTPIPFQDKRLASTDPVTFRQGSTTSKVLRDFAAASPELSSAVFSYLRLSLTDGYTAVAQKLDGTFDADATQALQYVIARLDVLPDYTQGFSGTASLLSTSESLAKELLFEGALCGELVLDKVRMPSRIQPISVSGLKMQPDKDGYLVPVQNVGGSDVVLDSPAITYIALDQSLLDAYASSPLEPAIKAVLFSEQFITDIQRVVRRAIHPRVDVELDEEKFRKNIPPEIEHDPDQVAGYLNAIVEQIQSMVDGLEPEEALVHFDSVGINIVNNGNSTVSSEYEFMKNMAESKMTTGTKTMPAVLGMGSGSQNIASTESMLFVKAATGAIQKKLNEFYSRMFTLALRLMGHDVIVRFKYNAIELRPESELESNKSVKQARILELLSLGLMTDEEACLELTGKLPPKGYKPLTGTMFKGGGAQEATDESSNAGSALNKDVKGDNAGVKSQNTKKNPQQQKPQPTKH